MVKKGTLCAITVPMYNSLIQYTILMTRYTHIVHEKNIMKKIVGSHLFNLAL